MWAAWNSGALANSQALSQALIIGKEKSLILDDGAPYRKAELITLELGQISGIEEIACIQIVVAVELKKGAMKSIGSAAAHRGHYSTRGPTKLGTVIIGEHPELSDRFGAQGLAGHATGRSTPVIGHIGPIQQKSVLIGPGTGNGQFEGGMAACNASTHLPLRHHHTRLKKC